MKRIILLITFAMFLMAGLTGCIKLQMPDDLISDTVDVIKGDDDDEAPVQESAENTFTHSVVGAADSPVSELILACHTELALRVEELLGTSDLNFTVTNESVSIIDDKAIANCAVAVE